MKTGSIASADTLYDQVLLKTTLNGSVATNQNATYTLGTYTMPMNGTVVAHCTVQSNWSTNIQEIYTSLQNSTPAPTTNALGNNSRNGLGGVSPNLVSHALAQWSGVSAGTLITLKMTFYVGIYAPTVTVPFASVIVRAHRA